ncbi:MAG: hypothetical protein AcusKO_21950 [Acuticoccus sp.]
MWIWDIDPQDRNVINGSPGESDYISGTDDHDLVYGRQGNDTLLGSEGYDDLRGGYGVDEVDYFGSCCGVTVNLETGKGWGGHAHGDTYTGIENIRGSQWADTLIGDAGDNTIDGWRGNDMIEGGRGDDDLRGGDGNDTITGGSGDDTLYGGKDANVLTGDNGEDVFTVRFIGTETTIADFTQSEDTIHLIGFYDYAYFMAMAQQVGNDVHFSRDNDYLNYTATLIIEDVALADLEAGDFLFN